MSDTTERASGASHGDPPLGSDQGATSPSIASDGMSAAGASSTSAFAASTASASHASAGAPPQQPTWQPAGPFPSYPQAAWGSYASAQPPKERFSRGSLIILGIILFAIVFLFTIGALSCSSAVATLTGVSSSSTESAYTVSDTVAVIDIDGTIQYDGTANSPEGLRELLLEAENDSNIKAVVLRVNSGGGTATAGEEMAALVRDFSKPVVVSSASINCSAAYEISSQADYIFVNETTAIGAIGTIMQIQDISGLLDMLGITVESFASSESKDSSYGTRSLTDEEREYYQDLVEEINDTFIRNVAEGRNMTIEEVEELATGMQFAGTTSVENGLADEVGGYDAALTKAAELGGITGDYDVINLSNSSTTDLSLLLDLLSAESDSVLDELDLSSLTAEELLALLKDGGILS